MSVKFVPKLVLVNQKENSVSVVKDFLDCVKEDKNFLKTLITDHKLWLYSCDLETKVQSL